MINKSPNAFADIVEAFERAINTPKGIRIACGTRGKAFHLRQRFNYFRKLDRAKNREIYPLEDPRHGLSVYDRFELRIPVKGAPDEHVLYIEPRLVENLNIEEI